MLVMPNIDLRCAVECEFAAIVAFTDPRIQELCQNHPTLLNFLGRFHDQFQSPCWPALLILRHDAPDACRTAEAVTAFRDVISISTIPLARARRLYFDRGEPLAYSTVFQFYPWTIDKNFEHVVMTNPASLSAHLLSLFRGQSFPEQSRISLMERDIDMPLAEALLTKWVVRFARASSAWNDRALFRSLNMANEAARMPALVAATVYDVGRTLALWVSAYEIVAHPGGDSESNFATVAGLIENVKWLNSDLGSRAYKVKMNGKISQRPLATWLCKKVYELRNDYLHGNDVVEASLFLNKKPIIDLAACIYRLVLTGILDLDVNQSLPISDSADEMGKFISYRMDFRHPQKLLEAALQTVRTN